MLPGVAHNHASFESRYVKYLYLALTANIVNGMRQNLCKLKINMSSNKNVLFYHTKPKLTPDTVNIMANIYKFNSRPFKFHKVVQEQNSGAGFIPSSSAV